MRFQKAVQSKYVPPLSTDPAAWRTGDFTMSAGDMLDMDKNFLSSATDTPGGMDLQFTGTFPSLTMVYRNGTRHGPIGYGLKGPDICKAQEYTGIDQPVSLRVGVTYCVRTSEGHWGEYQITKVFRGDTATNAPAAIRVAYKVW